MGSGGLLGSVGFGSPDGLFGSGLFGAGGVDAPNIPGVGSPGPSILADQNSLAGLIGQIDQLYGTTGSGNQPGTGLMGSIQQNYGRQQSGISDLMNKNLQNTATNLDPATGTVGKQLAQEFNRSGLLNSGAFNEALAQQFVPVAQQGQQQLLQSGLGQFDTINKLMQQQNQDVMNLNGGQVQRQFSLEDWFRNAQQNQQLAQSGANLQVNLANQQSRDQLNGALLGAGGTLGGAAVGK